MGQWDLNSLASHFSQFLLEVVERSYLGHGYVGGYLDPSTVYNFCGK